MKRASSSSSARFPFSSKIQSASVVGATTSARMSRSREPSAVVHALLTQFRFKPKKPIHVTGYETGEDALFGVCCFPRFYVGVADGVGGYAKRGVNPAELSNKLMSFCSSYVAFCEHNGLTNIVSDPTAVLDCAFDALVKSRTVKAGGTTAVLFGFDGITRMLTVANLGDSGFLVLRRIPEPTSVSPERGWFGWFHRLLSKFKKNRRVSDSSSGDSDSDTFQIIMRSEPQQHRFNCPYQLSLREYVPGRTRPIRADRFELELLSGDIVITGTDGVFDNVFTKELLDIVNRNAKPTLIGIVGSCPSLEESWGVVASVADDLLDLSVEHAYDPDFKCPFNIELENQKLQKRRGGKIDDITLSVSVVVEADVVHDADGSFGIPSVEDCDWEWEHVFGY